MRRRLCCVVCVSVVVVVVSASLVLRPSRSVEPAGQEVVSASAPPASPAPVIAQPVPAPPPPPPSPRVMQIDLEATEPTWVSLSKADGSRIFVGLLAPGGNRKCNDSIPYGEVARGTTINH